MKFHIHRSIFDRRHDYADREDGLPSKMKWRAYYDYKLEEVKRRIKSAKRSDSSSGEKKLAAYSDWAIKYLLESLWYENVRPYYKVWPSVCDALSKINVESVSKSLEIPKETNVLLRFAEGSEPVLGEYKMESALVGFPECNQSILHSVRKHEVELGYLFYVWPHLYRRMPSKDGDEAIEDFAYWNDIRSLRSLWSSEINGEVRLQYAEGNSGDIGNAIRYCIRVALSVSLMADDPSIITSEVLTKDRRAYEETKDSKYIAKAKKRGVVGWNIGESYETCPHYRRPHFGIRYTGKGGTIPRVVPIKGAVVHRKRLTEVPTGYITPDGVEVEPSSTT